MTRAASSLSTVQDLYLKQIALWNVLDRDALTADEISEARRNLKEFSVLLKQADWQVMGGEDVYATLRNMQQQVAAKLRAPRRNSARTPVRSRVKPKPSKKTVKRKSPKTKKKGRR